MPWFGKLSVFLWTTDLLVASFMFTESGGKNVTKTPSQNDGMTPDPHDFLKNLVGIVGNLRESRSNSSWNHLNPSGFLIHSCISILGGGFKYIFYVHPYWKISALTYILLLGWSHQPVDCFLSSAGARQFSTWFALLRSHVWKDLIRCSGRTCIWGFLIMSSSLLSFYK